MIKAETLAVLMFCVIVIVAILSGVREWARQRSSKAAKDQELLAVLQSVRRGIVAVSRRIGERDRISQEELKDAKRLILDVENRLRNEMQEVKDIVRDTRPRSDGGARQNFSFGGQTNAQIGDGENQQNHE